MTTEAEAAFFELLDELAATQARIVELADDPTTLLEAPKCSTRVSCSGSCTTLRIR